MRTETLYYGNNGVHHFWQNSRSSGEENNVCIFLNHGQKIWICHLGTPGYVEDPVLSMKAKEVSSNTSFPLQGGTIQEIVSKLETYFDIQVEFNTEKIWQGGTKNEPWALHYKPKVEIYIDAAKKSWEAMPVDERPEIKDEKEFEERGRETWNKMWSIPPEAMP